jgi:hypothetical protein
MAKLGRTRIHQADPGIVIRPRKIGELQVEDLSRVFKTSTPGITSYSIAKDILPQLKGTKEEGYEVKEALAPETEWPLPLTKTGMIDVVIRRQVPGTAPLAIEAMTRLASTQQPINRQKVRELIEGTLPLEARTATKGLSPAPVLASETIPALLPQSLYEELQRLTPEEQTLALADASEQTIKRMLDISREAYNLTAESRDLIEQARREGTQQRANREHIETLEKTMQEQFAVADASAKTAAEWLSITIGHLIHEANQTNDEAYRSELLTRIANLSTLLTSAETGVEQLRQAARGAQYTYIPSRGTISVGQQLESIGNTIRSNRANEISDADTAATIKANFEAMINRRNSALHELLAGGTPFKHTHVEAARRRALLTILPKIIAHEHYSETLKEVIRARQSSAQPGTTTAITGRVIITPPSTEAETVVMGEQGESAFPYLGYPVPTATYKRIFAAARGLERNVQPETTTRQVHRIPVLEQRQKEAAFVRPYPKVSANEARFLALTQPIPEQYPIGLGSNQQIFTTRTRITKQEDGTTKFIITTVRQPSLNEEKVEQLREYIRTLLATKFGTAVNKEDIHLVSAFGGILAEDRKPHLIVSFYLEEDVRGEGAASREYKQRRVGESSKLEEKILAHPRVIVIPIDQIPTGLPFAQYVQQAIDGLPYEQSRPIEGTATGEELDNLMDEIARNIINIQKRHSILALHFLRLAAQPDLLARIRSQGEIVRFVQSILTLNRPPLSDTQYTSVKTSMNVSSAIRAAAKALVDQQGLLPHEKEIIKHIIDSAFLLGDEDGKLVLSVVGGDIYGPIEVDDPTLYQKAVNAYIRRLYDAQRIIVSAELNINNQQIQLSDITILPGGYSDTIVSGQTSFPLLAYTTREAAQPRVSEETTTEATATAVETTGSQHEKELLNALKRQENEEILNWATRVVRAITQFVLKINETGGSISEEAETAIIEAAKQIRDSELGETPKNAFLTRIVKVVRDKIPNIIEALQGSEESQKRNEQIGEEPSAAAGEEVYQNEGVANVEAERIAGGPITEEDSGLTPGDTVTAKEEAKGVAESPGDDSLFGDIPQKSVHLFRPKAEQEHEYLLELDHPETITLKALRERLSGRRTVYIAGPRYPQTDRQSKINIFQNVFNLAQHYAEQGYTIITGGAQGTDLIAVQAALEKINSLNIPDEQKQELIILVLPIKTVDKEGERTNRDIIEEHIRDRLNKHNQQIDNLLKRAEGRDIFLKRFTYPELFAAINKGIVRVVTIPGERATTDFDRQGATTRDKYMFYLADESVFVTPEYSTNQYGEPGGTATIFDIATELVNKGAKRIVRHALYNPQTQSLNVTRVLPAGTGAEARRVGGAAPVRREAAPTQARPPQAERGAAPGSVPTTAPAAEEGAGGEAERPQTILTEEMAYMSWADLVSRAREKSLPTWVSALCIPISVWRDIANSITNPPQGSNIQEREGVARWTTRNNNTIERETSGNIRIWKFWHNKQNGTREFLGKLYINILPNPQHIQIFAPGGESNAALQDLKASLWEGQEPKTVAILGSIIGSKEGFAAAQEAGRAVARSGKTLIAPLVRGHSLIALMGALLERDAKIVVLSPLAIANTNYVNGVPQTIIDYILSEFVDPSIRQVFEIRSDQDLTSAKQTIINKLKDAAREGRIVFVSVSDPEKHYLSLLNEAKRDNASRESVNATIQLYQSLAASIATGDIIVFHGKSSEAADRDRQQTQSQTSKPLVNAGDVAVILTLISRAGWQERNLERQRKNKVLQQLGQIYLVQLPGESRSTRST